MNTNRHGLKIDCVVGDGMHEWTQVLIYDLGGRASQVAKREIFLALIEHGPHHFFHKQLLNTHIALGQLLNAHISLLNCSHC